MTPAELQQLLITRAPDVPGITAAARRDDENPYGLTVTLSCYAPPAPASHAPITPTTPLATSSLPSPAFLVRLPIEPVGYSSPALSSARTPAASGRT